MNSNEPLHSMTAKSVLADILEPGAMGGAPAHWDAALAAMPTVFPDVAAVPARRAAVGLPAEREAALCALAREVADEPALRCFAWYAHWRTFVKSEAEWGLPVMTRRLGDRAGLFYELLALEFPVALAKWHRQLGYPADVTTETVQQIVGFDANHLRGEGRPGVYPGQFCWLSVYLTNPYVRLGRFEYMLIKHYGANAWKNVRDGRVRALAEDRETPEGVTGLPIAPTGQIVRQPVTLASAEWTPVLRKGMDVLDLHIPSGGGMSWEAVTGSAARAVEFFARHHPDRPVAALVCVTWFLDAQLAALLPADANISRLQRAVYLTPIDPQPGGLWHLFLRDVTTTPVAELPRGTALQRAVAGFLETGGTWNGGAMFVLREDLLQLREGMYREEFTEG